MSIRDRRIAAGLTQTQLADILEVTQSSISHWEHGDAPLVKYQRKLAKVLRCTVDDLRVGKEDHEED